MEHLKKIPGVKLPDPRKYTLYERCKEANLQKLKSEYSLPTPQLLHYTLIAGDLLTFQEASVIAHQADCSTFQPQGLAADIASRLGTNSHANRQVDSRNPSLCRSNSQPTPGTIHVDWSDEALVWVAHLYAQKDCCLPNRKEDASMRMMWFKGCLVLLENFMHEHELETVAFPFGVGCASSGGEWNRYSDALNQWAEEHAETLTVYVVRKAD